MVRRHMSWPAGAGSGAPPPGRRAGARRPAAATFLLLLAAGTVSAQSPTPGGTPPPPGMSMATSAAMRFPQPVRVGDLLQRDVIQPVESQNFLGTLRQIVRNPDGTIAAVIDLGGFLGFGSRPVSVPVDALFCWARWSRSTPSPRRSSGSYRPSRPAPPCRCRPTRSSRLAWPNRPIR